ncbi:LytTR family DNA-binding domain-containing protein [Fusibacter ferrireducens]|uniref:LytTR family transcriptional regulator DNA-binding domain-containing protein n=1 Tax=Fusibacter ferrireducens TaxID=2785058 RepID=A0ABR9ZZV3_9FIRM|nr:LytTR family DNA-binding domain-containing protein [Fusibacter ferrireducens]MBF4695982.1 LytTR family transcriptional regulator DNA-binding domain-containing protein [Fusibacter ferrireducens]
MVKVSVFVISEDQEEEVLIRLHDKLDEGTIKSIESLVNSTPKQSFIFGKSNDQYFKLKLDEVYYIESVDRKQFIYTDTQILETDEKLYALEAQFSGSSLVRVSKSMILNLDQIDSFAPKLSGNLEAQLSNNEKVSISRRYVSGVKKQLGMKEGL